MQNRHVKLVETGLEIGEPGLTSHKAHRFHPSLKLSKRIYPHIHNMDGFYVAKLRKIANGVKSVEAATTEAEELELKKKQKLKKVKENAKKKAQKLKKKEENKRLSAEVVKEAKEAKEAKAVKKLAVAEKKRDKKGAEKDANVVKKVEKKVEGKVQEVQKSKKAKEA